MYTRTVRTVTTHTGRPELGGFYRPELVTALRKLIDREGTRAAFEKFEGTRLFREANDVLRDLLILHFQDADNESITAGLVADLGLAV